MARWLPLVVSAAMVGLTATACALGPTTQADVCAEFDKLGDRLLHANGVLDNALFGQADDLADVAERYAGEPDLAADAAALAAIADSDSTTSLALMDATSTIAGLCGHPLGAGALVPHSGGVADVEPEGPPGDTWLTPGDEPTTAAPPTTSPNAPPAAAVDSRTVAGPGGLSVSIPGTWVVGDPPAAANRQAADPATPQDFVRFGASPPPGVPLLTEIEAGERTNPNVRNGYRRIRLEEVAFLGGTAVDWEFTFVKQGVTRHALGRYWRAGGFGYLIYLSTPDTEWESLRPVFDLMADTVVIH